MHEQVTNRILRVLGFLGVLMFIFVFFLTRPVRRYKLRYHIYGSYDSPSPLRGNVYANNIGLLNNTGTIAFTTRVVVNLLFMARETAG